MFLTILIASLNISFCEDVNLYTKYIRDRNNPKHYIWIEKYAYA